MKLFDNLTKREGIPVKAIYGLMILVLLANSVVVFYSRSSLIQHKGADEEVWVRNAILSWETKTGSPISHTPFFHDLIIPFVANIFFETQTGYALWKFLLFLLSYFLLFYVLSSVSNLWVALVLTVHFQFGIDAWSGPTYTLLAMVFYLAAAAVLIRNANWLGVSLGFLLLGSLVRFELALFLVTFLTLLVVFCLKNLSWRRLMKQFAIPAVLFLVLIYWHGSSLTRFPREYFYRGNQSVVWYMVDYLYYHGYFAEYTDAGRGFLPLELQDSVLVEHFGKTLQELNNSSLLEMFRLNPTLLKARYSETLQQFPSSIVSPYRIILPCPGSRQPLTYSWQFLAVAALPLLVARFARRSNWSNLNSMLKRFFPDNEGVSPVKGLPKEFILLVASSLAGFVPWLMTFPQSHYLIMVVPSGYVAVAALINFTTRKITSLITISASSA